MNKTNKEINIIIGADLVPTKVNTDLFEKGEIYNIIDDNILNNITSSNFFCFNLETPLIKNINPIEKNGPALYAKEETINGIRKLNPKLIFLGNNHILDQNYDGLSNTEKILQDNNIPFIGVGNNIDEARENYIYSINNYKIGFYNCTEHEFSLATLNTPGANLFNPEYTYEDIKKLKSKCNKVIMIYHGGKEQYRYPSPELKIRCEKMIDSGADIVICQHSHCIGSMENYHGKTIIFGQGNFIFRKLDNEYWNNGLLINLKIDIYNNDMKIEYIPIISTNNGIRAANSDEHKKIMNDFFKRSKDIENKEFLEKEYKIMCDNTYNNYISNFLGKKFIFRVLNKITNGKFYKHYYRKDSLLAMLNYIECETHREVLIQSLKNRIYDINERSK